MFQLLSCEKGEKGESQQEVIGRPSSDIPKPPEGPPGEPGMPGNFL
jgi:hypothetical protein